MRKAILLLLLATLLTISFFIPAAALAADPAVIADQPGCAPQYRALADAAVVEIRGTGDMEAVVLTDPLCWHCRLGHKLLGQYPELYGSLKLLFFPRASFIGSDMAAWIIEDAAGTERLGLLLDFAYGTLRQPKADNLDEARMLVLAQFAEAFPAMLAGTTLSELFVRLKQDHEAHVLAGAELARAAEIPGTPVLIAGGVLVMGYGPDAWLKALDKRAVCRQGSPVVRRSPEWSLVRPVAYSVVWSSGNQVTVGVASCCRPVRHSPTMTLLGRLMRYRSEIDGLRAFSVLGVVLFHFGILTVSGGFFGVDVFFVISGYLISSLLFAEIDTTGTLSISNFYQRRTRRILPALLVFCLLSYLLFTVVVHKMQSPFPHFGNSLLATLFSVSNIFFWQNAGYFALDSWAEPLLHTWSLGVEEQFYLVIPLLLFWLAKGRVENRQSRYLTVMLGMAFLSFAFCRWGHDLVGRDFVFYMLPTRMWELLVGVLVALLLRKYPLLESGNTVLFNILALTSVAVMTYGFFYYHETAHIAEKALVITAAAGLFLVSANERTLVGRLFSSPPFRLVGKISYSWYLWHWPMASLAVMIPVRFEGVNEPLMRVGLLACSLFAAYLSWKYVETPFRRIRNWSGCIKPLAPLFGLLVLIALGNSFEVFGGSSYSFEHRFFQGVSLKDSNQPGVGELGDPDKPISFVLLGNSHAQSVTPAIDELAGQYAVRGVFIWDGVMPFLSMRMADRDPVSLNYRQALLDYLKVHRIGGLLIVARLDHIWVHAQGHKILHQDKPLDIVDVEKVFLRSGCLFSRSCHRQGWTSGSWSRCLGPRWTRPSCCAWWTTIRSPICLECTTSCCARLWTWSGVIISVFWTLLRSL